MSYQNLIMLFGTIPTIEDEEEDDNDNGDGTYKSTKKKDEEEVSLINFSDWVSKKRAKNKKQDGRRR